MANTYPFTGPGTRWVVTDATAEDYLNVSRQNADHLHEALNTIMDTDAADGVVTGTIQVAGTWGAPVLFGTIRLWDDSGAARMKAGSNPSSASDGQRVNLTTDSAGPSF
ncbi:MAG: hypothetical protein A2Z99_08185 [Treponema sp. GWB1_62_6]|nr:MAG: hypothetical protein A2Z99_08185 [Treponema sp. GWB1_62_6]